MAGAGSDGGTSEHRALRDRLVDRLQAAGFIRTPGVADAFRAVARHVFVPGVEPERAYRDEALVTKYDADGRPVSSSSQPAIMAIMLEQLGLRPGQRVLEIGAGTGYNAALIAHVVGPAGSVVTVELDADIVAEARAHLAAAGAAGVEVVGGDGAFGWPAGAPYDRIILTVGAWDVAPAWVEQQAAGGRLVLPLALRTAQASVAFERVGGHLASRSTRGCGFMRLRGALAGPERIEGLGPEPGLFVEIAEERRLDGEGLYAALRQPGEDVATGVRVPAGAAWGGAGLWLAVREPRMARLTATGPAVERGLVPAFVTAHGFASTSVLVGERALAALVRCGQPGDRPGTFELGVRPLGPGGDELAEQLAAHVRAWDDRGRPSADHLRIRAYPRGGAELDGGASVIEKRHFRVVVEWGDAAP